MSKRVIFGIVAAVAAVMVLGGIVVWATGGGGTRPAALEESTATHSVSWYLYGGATNQSFWADLESVAGCDATGGVATGDDQETGATGKHISGVLPSPCRLQVLVNARAAPALYTWLNDTLSETYTPQNLTLVKQSSASNQLLRISLEDALIERIELPAFQSDTARPLTVGLTVRPEESTRNISQSGPYPPSGKPAPASTALFDVALSTGSLRASRFEPWSAAVKITRTRAADQVHPANQASDLSVGDLGLSISRQTSTGADRADHLHDWFDTLVVQGNIHPSQERTLTLTARDPALASNPPFLTVTFTNVGIFAQPSYALGNDPEKFLFYAEGASFAGPPSAAP